MAPGADASQPRGEQRIAHGDYLMSGGSGTSWTREKVTVCHRQDKGVVGAGFKDLAIATHR